MKAPFTAAFERMFKLGRYWSLHRDENGKAAPGNGPVFRF